MPTPISIAFVILFYASFFIFIAGTVYTLVRWIFTPKGKTQTYLGFRNLFDFPGQNSRWAAFINIVKRVFAFTSMSDDPGTRALSMTFHWSLWIVLAAHLDIVLSPYLEAAGLHTAILEDLGMYLGTPLGIIMIVSALLLVERRIGNLYLRRISIPSDYFAISLIAAIGITGVIQRFILPPGFAYEYVTPFIYSLIHFNPINVPLFPIFILHMTLASVLLIYFPFSKFMHPYSFFTSPTLHSIFTLPRIKG
ncbi:MAG: respiratory nitrate reductase subunit gamma [Thermoplasma acidophilum]|nr:respiratory nitrate reductase subunit gamma [Thermoplasma acidophilum]